MLEKYVRRERNVEGAGETAVIKTDPRFMVNMFEIELVYILSIYHSFYIQHNNINLLTLVSKDAISYGRQLLDVLFTKQEQSESLVYVAHAHKTSKSILDREKVDLLLGKYYSRYIQRSLTINCTCITLQLLYERIYWLCIAIN